MIGFVCARDPGGLIVRDGCLVAEHGEVVLDKESLLFRGKIEKGLAWIDPVVVSKVAISTAHLCGNLGPQRNGDEAGSAVLVLPDVSHLMDEGLCHLPVIDREVFRDTDRISDSPILQDGSRDKSHPGEIYAGSEYTVCHLSLIAIH